MHTHTHTISKTLASIIIYIYIYVVEIDTRVINDDKGCSPSEWSHTGKQKSCLTTAGFEPTTFGLPVRRSTNWATRSTPEKVEGMGFKYWILKLSRFIKSSLNCTQFRFRLSISTTYNKVWTEYSSMLTWWNKIVLKLLVACNGCIQIKKTSITCTYTW